MRRIQFREALNQAMTEEMERDERVFLIGEEVAYYNGAYKVSQGMLQRFGPGRVIDTPISEAAFSGLAIGAAMMGLRPIVEFMSWSFCFVAADQILNNAAKIRYMSGGQFKIPVVFRGNNGAGGQLAATHSWAVEALFSNVPGIKIAIPSTPRDAKGLLKTAIRDDDPVFFLEAERMLGMGARGDRDFSRYLHGDRWAPPENDPEFLIPFGQAEIKKPGQHCTVVAFGPAVHWALQAAEALEQEGIDIEVVDPRTIRPLDIQTILASVRRTHYCVVVDQSWPFASVASEIAAQVQEQAFDDLDNHIVRVNALDVPAPYAMNLEEEYLPNARRIAQAVRLAMYRT